jgi:hypothetical protein
VSRSTSGSASRRVSRSASSNRRARDEGSVLALVPAGFLVLMLLAAIAVDSAVSYLGQEQLHDTLSAAANDAVTVALNNASFYRSGAITIDPVAAGRAVCTSVAAQNTPDLHGLQVWMAVEGDSLQLKGEAQVDSVFGRVIPGLAHHTVRAAVAAVDAQGPVATAAGLSSPATAEVFAPLRCGS